MAIAAHALTAEQYFALVPELPPNSQLIEGQVVSVDTPAWRHQHAAGDLYHRLRLWTDAAPGRGMCGIPLDVRVDGRNVYQPDVWWLSESRRLAADAIRHVQVPDLAVEIVSPSTRRYDLGIKRRRYAENGLPELWIVDPRGPSAVVLRRSRAAAAGFDVEAPVAADGELRSSQLPGFSVRVRDLFP